MHLSLFCCPYALSFLEIWLDLCDMEVMWLAKQADCEYFILFNLFVDYVCPQVRNQQRIVQLS